MTERQRNKFSMYLSMLSFCNRRRWIWDALPAFSIAIQQFSERVETLQKLSQSQRRHTGGVAQEKLKLRNDLCLTAHQVSAAVVAWSGRQNPALIQQVRFSLTQLRTGKDVLCLERCRTIAAAAKANFQDLSQHGVTSEKLAKLQDQMDAFEAIMKKPRHIRHDNKKVTAQLAKEFAAADEILYQQLDNLIHHFRDSHFDFHRDYAGNRVMQKPKEKRSQPISSSPESTSEDALLD